MTTPRTVCFMCFSLLLVMAHANSNNNMSTTNQAMAKETNSTTPTSKETSEASSQGSAISISQTTIFTSTTPKPTKGQCLFSLPNNATMTLVLAALTVACFTLLLTTLMCACQVCHLRAIISRLKPHRVDADLLAFRERSEPPCKDKDHEDRKPTETCFMLSDVTTAQEESILEAKTEDQGDPEQTNAESSTDGLNGDVNQANSTGV